MAAETLHPAADNLRSLSAVPFAPYAVQGEGGQWKLTLGVEGVNCANCIQKIESALARQPEISSARVNFSTQRLNIEWRGEAARADTYAALVQDLGYKVRPFDSAAAKAASSDDSRFVFLCMAVAGFATGNIMLLSFALWSTTLADMGFATREFMHWMAALIAIPTVVFSGRPFFRSAFKALSHGTTNMDVPITVGVLLTTAMSIFETVRGAEHTYFDAVVMLLFFLLIGRFLDMKARSKARAAASDLLSLLSGSATIIGADGQYKVIPIRDLREGMIMQIAMGERLAADAVVLEGQSSLDTSLITGESLPTACKPGDALYSGMLNISAPLRVQVAKAANDSLLADIVRLMEKAEQGQARYVRIADKAARLYTPVVHLAALFTFIAWRYFSPETSWQDALMISVTVLIITCPCALGLAVPVVQVLATGQLLKKGIMLKSGDALERLAAIDTLLVDKTGTLTFGKPQLSNGESIAPATLQLAASMAHQSRHPLSQALATSFTGNLLPVAVSEHPGQGLEADYNGQQLRLGSANWCNAPQERGDELLELWLRQGDSLTRFTFTDPLRPDARETVEALGRMGIRVMLLSGDRKPVVEGVAAALGISSAEGELKPDQKFARLEALRKEGYRIGMVGDGLNDAPSLSGADASLSPSSAIDMAQNAADIVYMGENLAPITTALQTARFSQKLVWQNFVLAVLYNIVAVPLAMAGHVTPMIAALAMSGSSIVVIANSFRLAALKPVQKEAR